MESRRNSSEASSQDSIRCSSAKKSKNYCTDWEKHQKISQEEFYSCLCSTTFCVEQETMNKNFWQTLDSYLCMQEDLVKDNGHSLVLVLKSSGTLSMRIDHKESGTLLRKRCWWNSPKADVQLFVLRLHCPEVNSKAKDMVNCRFTRQPTRKRLRLFFAQLFLQTSSVFTEQSQTCVKNANPFTIDQGNLIWWWGNQSCSVRSRHKFLWRVMTQHIKNFYSNNMKSELRSCHNKINWENSERMQNFWVLWRTDRNHDERHWRFDTIQYSGLSCKYSSKRRDNITTERMDPRKH